MQKLSIKWQWWYPIAFALNVIIIGTIFYYMGAYNAFKESKAAITEATRQATRADIEAHQALNDRDEWLIRYQICKEVKELSDVQVSRQR